MPMFCELPLLRATVKGESKILFLLSAGLGRRRRAAKATSAAEVRAAPGAVACGEMPSVLVTGATGFLGAALLPRLQREGHEVRAYARRPEAVRAGVPVVAGDAVLGTGLDAALDGIDVAYYLIHSMEGPASAKTFDALELRAVENFATAAQAAGVRRVVYLGGLVPVGTVASRHLGSRLAVEEVLLGGATPEAVAFRASIVVGALSRSFRFLVRLVERAPLLPLPGWSVNRTQPVDERDVVNLLLAAATSERVTGPLSMDVAGPDVVTYGEMVEAIRDHLLLGRPSVRLKLTMTPIAAKVAAAIAGEDVGLIEPLMESLSTDLLPRDDAAAGFFGVRMHSFDAAVEHALGVWERTEALAGR